METEKAIRVAIIEDDRAVREGLGMIIGATPGFECTGKYFSVEDALRSLNGLATDVLLLDIHLPGMLRLRKLLSARERHGHDNQSSDGRRNLISRE